MEALMQPQHTTAPSAFRLLDLPLEIFRHIIEFWAESLFGDLSLLQKQRFAGISPLFDREVKRAVCRLQNLPMLDQLDHLMSSTFIAGHLLARVCRNDSDTVTQAVKASAGCVQSGLENLINDKIDTNLIYEAQSYLFVEDYGYECIIGFLRYPSGHIHSTGRKSFQTLLPCASYLGINKALEMLIDTLPVKLKVAALGVSLHAAIAGNQLDTVKLLLSKGAWTQWQSFRGSFPLQRAASLGHQEIVRLLLKNECNPNSITRLDLTLLVAAASAGQLEMMQLLIDHGADVNAHDHAALRFACSIDSSQSVRLLAGNGAHLHHISGGPPLLSIAISARAYDCVDVLLSLGAPINFSSATSGPPALFIAVDGRDMEMIEHLLRRGADPDITWEAHRNPLCSATNQGDREMMELLIRYGARLDSWDSMRGGLVCHAIHHSYDFLKYCLELGVDPNCVCPAPNHQCSSLVTAFQSKQEDMMETLLRYGASVDAMANGETALLTAIRERYYNAVDCLLRNGADPHVQCQSGTPLSVALRSGDKKIVALLKSYLEKDTNLPTTEPGVLGRLFEHVQLFDLGVVMWR